MEVLWTRDEGARREETRFGAIEFQTPRPWFRLERGREATPAIQTVRSRVFGTTRVVSSEYEGAMLAQKGFKLPERTCVHRHIDFSYQRQSIVCQPETTRPGTAGSLLLHRAQHRVVFFKGLFSFHHPQPTIEMEGWR